MKGGQWSTSPRVSCTETASTSAPPPGGQPDGKGPSPEQLQASQAGETAPPDIIQELVHRALPAAGYGAWTNEHRKCSQAPKPLQPLVTPQGAAGHHICSPDTQTLSSSKTNCALEWACLGKTPPNDSSRSAKICAG